MTRRRLLSSVRAGATSGRQPAAPRQGGGRGGGPRVPSYRFRNEEDKVGWMRRAAETYLGRYDTTAENLRRVLVRRVRRGEFRSGEELMTPELEGAIDAIVASHVVRGTVDDEQYARRRAAALRRAGRSAAGVRRELYLKGVPEAVVAGVIERGEAGAEAEQAAAMAYCRRNRVGPYRRPGTEPPGAEAQAKIVARMARQGFPWAVVKRTLALPLEPELSRR